MRRQRAIRGSVSAAVPALAGLRASIMAPSQRGRYSARVRNVPRVESSGSISRLSGRVGWRLRYTGGRRFYLQASLVRVQR